MLYDVRWAELNGGNCTLSMFDRDVFWFNAVSLNFGIFAIVWDVFHSCCMIHFDTFAFSYFSWIVQTVHFQCLTEIKLEVPCFPHSSHNLLLTLFQLTNLCFLVQCYFFQVLSSCFSCVFVLSWYLMGSKLVDSIVTKSTAEMDLGLWVGCFQSVMIGYLWHTSLDPKLNSFHSLNICQFPSSLVWRCHLVNWGVRWGSKKNSLWEVNMCPVLPGWTMPLERLGE